MFTGRTLLLLLLLSAVPFAQNDTIRVYEFYGQGCIHCAAVDRYLVNLEREFPQLEVLRFETTHSYENLVLGKKFCKAYGLECETHLPTPLVFINDTSIIGDRPLIANIKNIVIACQANGCIDPLERIRGVGEEVLHREPPLLVVVLAAMVDSINPCAFAVLIFMLQYVGSIASQRRMINVGLVYIVVVYITYMLAGLGLLTAFQSLEVTEFVYKIAAVLAIAAGLINIKDYFFYGAWFSLQIPKSQSARIKRYVTHATLPSAIILGILVSAVELPCTGGAYLAILAMLQWAEFWRAFVYLAIYNFFFVLPLIIILILFTLGYSAEKLEAMRMEQRKYMKLGIGLLLFLLGAGMLLGWFTGGYWTT